MGTPQVIVTETGEELVVLTRRDYDSLLAQAGDEAAEDRMTLRLVAESEAAIARGDDVVLPEEVWQALESGENPIQTIRRYRNIDLAELAATIGISVEALSDIESGARVIEPELLKAIARALTVPVSILIDP